MRNGVIGVVLAIAVVCVGAPTAVAMPTGAYVAFEQCSTHTLHVNGCIYAPVEGGYIVLGKTVVPISKPLILQAGLLREEEPFVKHLVGALNGETLTKVGQTIPGGLFGSPLLAVTELAGPANSVWLFSGEPLGLTLPVKVRLMSHLLGAECTVGTNAHPIELQLTSGTSGGLTGNLGRNTTIEEGGITVKSGIALVESGFAVPKAAGCGSAFVDEALDAKLGIPSSNNRIVFDSKIELVNSEIFEEHEG